MSKDTSDPAFPLAHDIPAEPGFQRSIRVEKGISIRDYFAAKALQSIINQGEVFVNSTAEEIALWSYEYADAMIAERAK